MSISIENAKKKLNVLELIPENPLFILSDLFSYGVSGPNFLYQVSIDGKYILDYLEEHLLKIDVFKDCIVKMSAYNIWVIFGVM